MGVPPRRIVWRHLVPNIGSLLVLDITRGVTGAILAEVAFSFIGIGIKVPDVSLGVLIGAATSQVQTFPWMFWVPLTVMFLLTGSLAMMNDGLRDAFDPSSSSSGSAKKRSALKTRVKGKSS
jgi:peptide/nickel transport system permease protein